MREAGLLENRDKQLFSLLMESAFQAMAVASFSVFLEYQITQASSVQSFLFVSVKGIFRLALKKALMQLFRVLHIQLWI